VFGTDTSAITICCLLYTCLLI